ncbi:MAG: hypothetical protein NTZ35_05995 [Ignavibacteriales bacterium]|nr:hypothetical protein [Ignavibacteriales bacterium]
MQRHNKASAALLFLLCVLLVLTGACNDGKRSGSQGNAKTTPQSEPGSRYSFEAHLSQGTRTIDVFTEGNGSLRALTIIQTQEGVADTIKKEIDGVVVNAACADLDRDSIPEIYVFAQSARSGSYANLYAFQIDQPSRQSILLPELDKRQSAGYLGHDTLWVQDSILVRRFPVYTEGDINVSATGGSRTLEYILQRDPQGNLYLHVSRVSNNR